MVETLRGLAPLVSPSSRILILGSFPGEESLRKKEYYAHERNGFWKILAFLLEPGLEFENYAAKRAFIKKHRLAVWDVIHSCERKTSADSRIKNPVPNDFAAFFARHPEIKTVLLNGRTAEKAWQTLASFSAPDLKKGSRRSVFPTAVYVPSTSPALASLTWQAKAALWQQALFIRR